MTVSAASTFTTLPELRSAALALLREGIARASNSAGFIDGAPSNLDVIAFTQSASLYDCYLYLRDFVAKQAVPTLAVGEYLDEWLNVYGIARKQATYAVRVLSFNPTASGVLTRGTLFTHDSGTAFAVVADTAYQANTAQVVVMSQVAGLAGNFDEGVTLSCRAPVDVSGAFTVAARPSSVDGAERETDAGAISRLQLRISNPPRGGAPADYESWALSIPGITRAWGIRNPVGAASAGVYIMADDNTPYGLPTEAKRLEVFNYIRDPRRGPPDDLYVYIPVAVRVNFDVRLVNDSVKLRGALAAELKDLFLRKTSPGGALTKSDISAAFISAGVAGYSQLSPPVNNDLTCQSGQILVLGAFNYA